MYIIFFKLIKLRGINIINLSQRFYRMCRALIMAWSFVFVTWVQSSIFKFDIELLIIEYTKMYICLPKRRPFKMWVCLLHSRLSNPLDNNSISGLFFKFEFYLCAYPYLNKHSLGNYIKIKILYIKMESIRI